MTLFDCTVIGDVFVDIIVTSHLPQFFYGGTSYCDFARATLGGSGNIAAGLSKLGAKVAFVGKAGNDFFGKLYNQDLKNTGVAAHIFFSRTIPTGLVMSFIENGKQRSFLVFRGANDSLETDEIQKAAWFLKRSAYVYFSGYSLVQNPQRNAILTAIEHAKKFNAKIIFDPGAYNIIKSNKQLFHELLKFCDVLSLNLEEAKIIANKTNVKIAINRLSKIAPLTALKCDEQGSILITQQKIIRIPGFKVKCLDPTGAGDAYTAALIYGLTHKLPLEAIGQLANWFAAQVTTRFGPRTFPSKSKINNFLQKLPTRES